MFSDLLSMLLSACPAPVFDMCSLQQAHGQGRADPIRLIVQ
jgi:hypothetical protein